MLWKAIRAIIICIFVQYANFYIIITFSDIENEIESKYIMRA